jgi:hypothetical protein
LGGRALRPSGRVEDDVSVRQTCPAADDSTVPKDGFVVSPPQPVEPIELLAASDREVQALADDVRVAFNKAEREVEAALAIRSSAGTRRDRAGD